MSFEGHTRTEKWKPFGLSEITEIFKGFSKKWWVSGGFAIDSFVGSACRPHADIDVGILRKDIGFLKGFFREFVFYAADPPGSGKLRIWESGEVLNDSIHDIWVGESGNDFWRFQIMIDDADGDFWVYRRDRSIRRPLSDCFLYSEKGYSYLKPEIQLLYKSLNPNLVKNKIDFESALVKMDPSAKIWLSETIKKTFGTNHLWLRKL